MLVRRLMRTGEAPPPFCWTRFLRFVSYSPSTENYAHRRDKRLHDGQGFLCLNERSDIDPRLDGADSRDAELRDRSCNRNCLATTTLSITIAPARTGRRVGTAWQHSDSYGRRGSRNRIYLGYHCPSQSGT